MKRTRWFVIGLLLLASTGCARRDWVSDMLTLADVSGTWTGSYVCDSRSSGIANQFDATFRQSGSRVTGVVKQASPLRAGRIELEGVVNGDVLSFTGRSLSVQATVDGDDMSGVLTGTALCVGGYSKSPFDLRRESSGRPDAR